GARLATQCPSCGYSNPAGFAFCGKCGARRAEAHVPPGQGSLPFASPCPTRPDTSPRRNSRRRVPLKANGSTSPSSSPISRARRSCSARDPKEARKLPDPLPERMMEAAHRYKGTVNQVMGDGVMALFGAPLAHEDHAVRECYAALDLQRAMRRL